MSSNQTPAPLAYPFRTAFQMIGVGPVKGYELINSGQLKTFKIGSKRMASADELRAFIARMQQAAA